MKKKNGSVPLVSVVMGSDSDFQIMKNTVEVLRAFGVSHEVVITSAHRSPQRTASHAKGAEERGIKVIIAGAGAAAHLAGIIASQTRLPVIGVPIHATPLNGMDALLSTVQMPGGVPVATMALGNAGAINAGLMAVRILALEDSRLLKKLKAYAEKMARDIEVKQQKIDCLLPANKGEREKK